MRGVFKISLGLFLVLLSGLGWAESSTVNVILSTPLSSRINRVGQPVQAVLGEPVTLSDGQDLPTGTTLTGQITAVESSDVVRHPGRLKLIFTMAKLPSSETRGIYLMPDTPDGWLNKADTYLTACKLVPGHSTRLLNSMLRRRLPCDRAVWNQVLGINSSTIPDPSTDEFMQEYNRHDVLLGTGDWLRLRSAVAP